MEKYFVTYPQSLALKELGFDEDCLAYYQKNKKLKIEKIGLNKKDFATNSTCYSITAPLKSQVFEWLYQKLGIEKGVMPLDIESQDLLLEELIDKVSSKHLFV